MSAIENTLASDAEYKENVARLEWPMQSQPHKTLTLTTMCIATFVAILDTTVVNLALHAIQNQLHTSIAVLQWVLDLYNLTYASFIMTGGILGDLFGRRRIFVWGMCLFTVGSLVCGLALNPSVLIAGRGLHASAPRSSFPDRSRFSTSPSSTKKNVPTRLQFGEVVTASQWP